VFSSKSDENENQAFFCWLIYRMLNYKVLLLLTTLTSFFSAFGPRRLLCRPTTSFMMYLFCLHLLKSKLSDLV